LKYILISAWYMLVLDDVRVTLTIAANWGLKYLADGDWLIIAELPIVIGHHNRMLSQM
jgi:hypothetical protein